MPGIEDGLNETDSCSTEAPGQDARGPKSQPASGGADRVSGKSSASGKNGAVAASEADGQSSLARTIESEIIPRLLLAHLAKRNLTSGTAPDVAAPMNPLVAFRETVAPILLHEAFTAEQVVDFADGIVKKALRASVDYIDALIAKGMSIEAVFMDVFSPAARHLGELWEDDRMSFVDVTLGLSRLQQLLRMYGPAFEADSKLPEEGRRILIAAMPGEQHTFGMTMVEEFFRRDGWDVHSESSSTRAILLSRARSEWFEVIGLSAAGDGSVALLPQLIKDIRAAALNRDVRVIVGGCAFLSQPANAVALGADLVAANGRESVASVESLLDQGRNAPLRC